MAVSIQLWVREELGRRGVQPPVVAAELKHVQIPDVYQGKGIHVKTEQAEEEGLNSQKIQDDGTFVALLKVCTRRKDLYAGRRLHADILKRGLLEKNIFIGNHLVNMYAKCGELSKAQEVFDELPVRNVVSWTALIAGYAQHGCGQKALNCFERMYREGFSPNAVTYVCILKACGNIGAADKGKDVHAEIVREGLLGKNIMVGTALLDMYVKCGALAKAQEVFDKLPVRNVVAWTALITGYAQHGHGEKALDCFELMRCEGLSPDAVTLLCILKACGSIGAVDKGTNIHAEIVRHGLLEENTLLGTALLDMYVKCGALVKAQEVFNELPVRDVVSWNVLIAGYAEQGYGAEAMDYFEQMQHEGLCPDTITFVYILKACGSVGDIEKGKDIHAEIVRQGFLEKSILIGNALLDMYVKCGALTQAQEVFDDLPVQDVVSWNVLIAGYVQFGHAEEALECFERMQHKGPSPDAVTLVCILKACGNVGAADKGIDMHAEIVRARWLEKDISVGTALLDMYAKCGVLSKLQEVFDDLPIQDVTSWNALMTGYAQHGHGEEALTSFERMLLEGPSPDAATLVCILKVCGSIGAADKGKDIHAVIVKEGFLEKSAVVGNALIDMYAKCGALAKAQEVFNELPVRNVVSWNTLITGYAQFGEDTIVLYLFQKMLTDSITPDPVTLTVVLNACSHSGLVSEGQMYFETMRACYGIIPMLEHHTCMVDLYGRAGRFDMAVAMIKKMPSDYFPVWTALMGACQKWGNVKLGRLAFDHTMRLDEKDVASYVCMRNIYAAAGMQVDADKIEALRLKKEALKKPEYCLWMDVDGTIGTVFIENIDDPQSKNICTKLEESNGKLSKENCFQALQDISVNAKQCQNVFRAFLFD